MANEKPTMNLTPEDLQNIVVAAIAAAKQPSELEQLALEEKRDEIEARKAQITQENQMRAESAQQQIAIMEGKRTMQKLCTHKHRRGDTHCVFITDDLGGYILCQKCQAVIRAGEAPSKNDAGIIYNTALFNQLFQECTSNGYFE